MDIPAYIQEIRQTQLKCLSAPHYQAQWDFMKEGCNCNPYKKDTPQWEVYEQSFDQCEIDELKRG